jgi:integrase
MPTKKKRRTPSHTWTDKNGQLYACYTFKDHFGKRKYKYRKAENPAHARALYQEMKAEHEEKGEESFDARRMTFKDLAAFAEKHFIKEPKYKDGLKIEGLRSHYDMKIKLAVLTDFFGRLKVREITHAHLLTFRTARLAEPTKRDIARHREALKKDKKAKVIPNRAMASVHRELALLRRVLNIAKRQRWITYNPFDGGGLISGASEVKRMRIISRDEEAKLLAACEGRYKHLRPAIICGLDTGMRSGEMFKLVWRDVDLKAREIHLIAMNTKTAQARTVGMTPRLHAELSELWSKSLKDLDVLVFGIAGMKKGWLGICKKAGLSEVRPHDLRHTAATRMIEGGLSIAETGRILGHSSPATTYRYINPTAETPHRAASVLHTYLEADEHKEESDAVN